MLPGWERADRDIWPQIALILALLATFIPGCCRTHREVNAPQPNQGKNLVFAPEEPPMPADGLARGEWPITAVYAHPAEAIFYREIVMDRQGAWGSDHDRPYRRFDSVRFGRTWR